MSILEFIIGTCVGIAGTIVIKERENSSEVQTLKNQIDDVLTENEKLSRRYKDAKRRNEDLTAELDKLKRDVESNSSDREDLQDDLDDARRKNKKLKMENAELIRKIEEYKAALAATENK